MKGRTLTKQQLGVDRNYQVLLLSLLVAAHGAYIMVSTLLAEIMAHRFDHLTTLLIDLPLLIGLSVIYLSTLLRRRKRTAWLVTVMAYTFYLGIGVSELLSRIGMGRH